MTQQINLYSPILLAPRRHFSARAMLQSLALLMVALVGLSLWSVNQTQGLKRNLASATAAEQAEHQRLSAALAARPTTPVNTSALEQELAQAHKQLADKELLLAELAPAAAHAQDSRSALLRVLARTVPAPVWLTEVKLVDGRVELAGATQQPEALRPWLEQLAAQPALAGQSLQALRVERSDAGASAGRDGRELWTFRVVSSRSGANTTAADTQPAGGAAR